MAKHTKTHDAKKRNRVKIGKLPEHAVELSKAEQKKVEGGTMKANADTQNSLAQSLKA